MANYPMPYIQFLVHFHGDRDYFECHEILEEYWKEIDSRNKDSIWVAFILLAVSNYHYRRGNFSGAAKTITKSIIIFSNEAELCSRLGIDHNRLMKDLAAIVKNISQNVPYSSYNIPISDPELVSLCQSQCTNSGVQWGVQSNLNNQQLIDKHSMRDRTAVIHDRLLALSKKGKKKGSED